MVGYSRCHAIGAPFLYLLALQTFEKCSHREAPSVVAFPHHTWEANPPSLWHGNYADQLRKREGDGAVVCLYWRDFDLPGVAGAYESRGLTVVTNGRREDPTFLERQYRLLNGVQRVVTNRVSTAFWYGGALGAELEVYGSVDGTPVPQLGESWCERLRRGPLGGSEAMTASLLELGESAMRSPEELRNLLGLNPSRNHVGRRLDSFEERLRTFRKSWRVS